MAFSWTFQPERANQLRYPIVKKRATTLRWSTFCYFSVKHNFIKDSLCAPHGWLVPASTSCPLPFYVSINLGAPCSAMQASHFLWYPTCQDRPFLSLEDVHLEYQPVLLDPSSFQGNNPWDSAKQISKEVEVCSLDKQGCGPAFCCASSSWDTPPGSPGSYWTMWLQRSHSHCSQGCLQLSYPWPVLPCFLSIRSSRAPFLRGFTRLRELGLFSMEKKRLRGFPPMYINTWKERIKKRLPHAFQWCPVTGTGTFILELDELCNENACSSLTKKKKKKSSYLDLMQTSVTETSTFRWANCSVVE